MAQIFQKWVNKIPSILLLTIVLLLNLIVFTVWYFFSPEFTDVGYTPKQPIAFSHQIHAGVLKLDCQYCHYTVEESKTAIVPSTQVCMNCHNQIATDSPKLELLYESWEQDKAIEWVRVHNLPDYVYFNHSAHINVGIGCESCHGRVDVMEEVSQQKTLSMSFCLDCHREPEGYIRPISAVTSMGYETEDQYKLGEELVAKNNIKPPTYCQSCHY